MDTIRKIAFIVARIGIAIIYAGMTAIMGYAIYVFNFMGK